MVRQGFILKKQVMIQFAALRQSPGVSNPFTYMSVGFPTEWLLSATAADERQDERKTWSVQIVRFPRLMKR